MKNIYIWIAIVVIIGCFALAAYTYRDLLFEQQAQPEQHVRPLQEQALPPANSDLVSVSEVVSDGWFELVPYPKLVSYTLTAGRYRVTYKSDVTGVPIKAYRSTSPAFYKIKDVTDGTAIFDVNNGEDGEAVFIFGNESSSSSTRGYLQIVKIVDFQKS